MTTNRPPHAKSDQKAVANLVVKKARDAAGSEGFQAKMYQAISVQRPVVVEFLKSLRREKPDATAPELLRMLDARYVAAVTVTGTAVGASAALPVVGTGIALSLGVADLLFFYEISALYVLAAAELHGIEVTDAERARPLVFGMLLGEKSQSQVAKIVLHAAGAGGVNQARGVANTVATRVLPSGWGEVLTQQLPDSALAPVATVIARQALKESAKFGSETLGKVIPFGIGAVVGGVGNFAFGRDVVKAARIAFPEPPAKFPDVLVDFSKPDLAVLAQSRAVKAMQAAAGHASDFGEAAWGKANVAMDVFRSVDLDGDGVRVEARALTAAKSAGATAKRAGLATKGAAIAGAGAVGARMKRMRDARASKKSATDPGDEPARTDRG
jgi:hypothetical protein